MQFMQGVWNPLVWTNVNRDSIGGPHGHEGTSLVTLPTLGTKALLRKPVRLVKAEKAPLGIIKAWHGLNWVIIWGEGLQRLPSYHRFVK